jgi:glycosyltransferase involved in cell wall biosynthesis
VKDGISGFIVPSEDPAALSVAILRLLSDPSLARAMGAAGKDLARERFTTETMMSQIAGAYGNLLSGR